MNFGEVGGKLKVSFKIIIVRFIDKGILMFFKKKKSPINDYLSCPYAKLFLNKLSGYRMISTTILNKESREIDSKEVAYKIFETICGAHDFVASKRIIDGQEWYWSVHEDKPKLTGSTLNVSTGESEGSGINHIVLHAILAIRSGIKNPRIECSTYTSYRSKLEAALALWAMGYEISPSMFSENGHEYIISDAKKIISKYG